jgi:hypothetical protein
MLKRKPFIAFIHDLEVPDDRRACEGHLPLELERKKLAFDREGKFVLLFCKIPREPAEFAVIRDAYSLSGKKTGHHRREAIIIAVHGAILELAMLFLWRPERSWSESKEIIFPVGNSGQAAAIVEMVFHVPRAEIEPVDRPVFRT